MRWVNAINQPYQSAVLVMAIKRTSGNRASLRMKRRKRSLVSTTFSVPIAQENDSTLADKTAQNSLKSENTKPFEAFLNFYRALAHLKSLKLIRIVAEPSGLVKLMP